MISCLTTHCVSIKLSTDYRRTQKVVMLEIGPLRLRTPSLMLYWLLTLSAYWYYRLILKTEKFDFGFRLASPLIPMYSYHKYVSYHILFIQPPYTQSVLYSIVHLVRFSDAFMLDNCLMIFLSNYFSLMLKPS